ncbi:MAG TPA: LysM peptidoglycan-binding domain-containing protein, partial [Cytophagaceae bacterium]
GEDRYTALGGKFTDNFRFEKKDTVSWEMSGNEDAFNSLNTKFNESPGSFTKDGKKFYYTSCDEKIKHDDYEEYNCVIYVSKFQNGKWQKPERLNDNINMKGYWNAQPSVSPNGDTLFFVSKRPGGLGMHDIWYSTCKGDDNWGVAKNMGPKVNTKHIDMSPCYHSSIDSVPVLFFASNGHQGFGGLDIFEAKGPKFENVRNLGLPFNSNKDDFYFVAGTDRGYLSSNRDGGYGNDDIYTFKIRAEEEAVIAKIEKDSLGNSKSISIEGKLVDATTKDPASDVVVKLNDANKKTIKTTTTNEKGEFRYENLPADDYKVVLDEKNTNLTTEVKYMSEDLEVKKSRKKPSKKLFENIYFDFDKYTLRPEAEKSLEELVEYYKKHPQLQIEMNANTDNWGSDAYNIELSKNRGKTALNYLIKNGVDKSALVVNALGEGNPIATNENAIGRQLNRRVEFYVVGGPGYRAKAMTYIIQPKTTLYSVAKMFNMTVEELKEMNNLKDENILAYRPLRVRRIGDDDIIAPITMSLGSANIMNASVDSVGVVDKVKPSSNIMAKELRTGEDLYIVEPKNTLYSIGKQYGMTVDELKELNGLKSDLILIGQRLKVKSTIDANVTSYVVKEGDTMFTIAKRFGLTLEELRQLNNLSSYTLYKGMVLRVSKNSAD